MSTPAPTPIREWRDVSPDVFRDEILPAHQPALLRGAVRDWPAVRAGLESPAAMANYLRGFDTGASAETMYGDPAIGGRFFYNDDLTGLNFERRPERIAASLERLLALLDAPAPPALYVGAVPHAREPARLRARQRAATAGRRRSCRACGSAIASPCRRTTTSRTTSPASSPGAAASRCFRPSSWSTCTSGPLEFTLAGQPISMVRLRRAGLRTIPALSRRRSTTRRWRSSNPATRCSFRTCGGTTSSRASASTCW